MTLFWHNLEIQDVLHRLQSSPEGLYEQRAQNLLKEHGPNALPEKPLTPGWRHFLQQFRSPIVGILGVAALLKLLIGHLGNFLAIIVVIIFNAILGFFQERKAQSSMKSLRSFSTPLSRVIRNGHLREIPTHDLVVGDIILLESGTRVPADARLIETHALDLNESMLTGESTVVRKYAEKILDEKTPTADQTNMVFSGTIVTRGRARAVVIATGTHTHTASIIQASESAAPPPSPLSKRLTDFGWTISMIAIALMVGTTLIGLIQGIPLTDLIMTCVSLTVSAVPEGLPIAVTVVLAQGLLSMAKRKAVIRRLPTIETLGCTTLICTDKTGTLTQNKMQVAQVVSFEKDPYWLFTIASHCHETRMEKTHIGDPIEIALVDYAQKQGYHEKYLKDLTLPYEPENKMMACSIEKEEKKIILVKGAPEKITSLAQPFDLKHFESELHAMTNKGLRVLAFAYGEQIGELIIAGLIGLQDPPRDEVISAIQTAHTAGIRVAMITGDQPETAQAIARQIGFPHSTKVLTGKQIDEIEGYQLHEAILASDIFARVTPTHKLTIVEHFQQAHHTVAMTGDGVNDAPPLRQADIGIAMGSGTDVAREASDMVILDDNFVSIVEAIRRGRILFKNLQRMAAYLLTTCFGGVLTIAFSVLLGLPLPLLPLQILWVNLVTDGTTTIPLAMEGEHGNCMLTQPRKSEDRFLPLKISMRSLFVAIFMMIGTLSLYLWSLQSHSLEYSRTIAFTTLSLFQIFNALNSRSIHRSLFFSYKHLKRIPFLQNPWLLTILGCCLLLQIAAVEIPFLQLVLETTSLRFHDWMRIAFVCSGIIVAVEIHKFTGQPSRK